MRTEQEIFEVLESLCASPGYIRIVAFICIRDNLIKFKGNITKEDLAPMFSESRLTRTEITTLIGLMLKHGSPDCSLISPVVFKSYLDDTDKLLKELHGSMLKPAQEKIIKSIETTKKTNFFETGLFLREPIFYGPESAYLFQYRDFSIPKYKRDDEWLLHNKGFSIEDAWRVVSSICAVQADKSTKTLRSRWNPFKRISDSLSTFSFTTEEAVNCSGLVEEVVNNVLNAFSIDSADRNKSFRSINDFNIANSQPLIQIDTNSYILLQSYNLVEALYETPAYWMMSDSEYVNDATQHRGAFSEQFIHECLASVFGSGSVYSNVIINGNGNRQLGEIDVLVLFGDRAIVVQAKSKRLTIEARKGNDGRIGDDFKKGIQDSYDQGLACAKFLSNASKYQFIGGGARKIQIPDNLSEIYVLCTVSDHYPALSFQSMQFLQYKKSGVIQHPFVLDIFTLDVMTEMLKSPLQLLSYINRRVNYTGKVFAMHELTILSYHLKTNLWVEDEYDMLTLGDDISADLDLAMYVRRDGLPGDPTPDGILTRFTGTPVERIINHIEHNPDPALIDFGFFLLSLSENTMLAISAGINDISVKTKADKNSHNMVLGFKDLSTGLTIHCNEFPISLAMPRLSDHCELRKYSQKARTWFGICIDPNSKLPRFGCKLNYEWQQNSNMEFKVQSILGGVDLQPKQSKKTHKKVRVGRNSPCPCGSRKKYKRCCINR